jgi:hypothetical protein
MVLVMFHSYCTTSFLYESRLITEKRLPTVFKYMPYVVYPSALLGCAVFMLFRNDKVTAALDKKYTPIWIEISKKL